MISEILTLALDPSNRSNQQYLLQILLVICKQLKPQSNAQNLFKDLENENEDSDKDKQPTISNMDPESSTSKNVVKYLNLVKNQLAIFNLLLVINTSNRSSNSTITNQSGVELQPFG